MKNEELSEIAINPAESNAVAAGISRPSLRTVSRRQVNGPEKGSGACPAHQEPVRVRVALQYVLRIKPASAPGMKLPQDSPVPGAE